MTDREQLLRLCGLLEGDINRGIIGAKTYAPLVAHVRASLAEPDWWHPIDVKIEVSDIWFWWNGDHTFPVNILNDGKELWACCGQWGWTRAQRLTDMGGLWTPCIPPEPNKEQQGEAVIGEW